MLFVNATENCYYYWTFDTENRGSDDSIVAVQDCVLTIQFKSESKYLLWVVLFSLAFSFLVGLFKTYKVYRETEYAFFLADPRAQAWIVTTWCSLLSLACLVGVPNHSWFPLQVEKAVMIASLAIIVLVFLDIIHYSDDDEEDEQEDHELGKNLSCLSQRPEEDVNQDLKQPFLV